MTERQRPLMVSPMTGKTAAVFTATELMRHAINDDTDTLRRESIATTMLPPEVLADTIHVLADIAGAALQLMGADKAHDVLDNMLIQASFDQITETNGGTNR